MAGTALVLVHGRSQQMPSSARRGPAEEAAFVAKKRQAWLAGLAKGLTLAGLPPVEPSSVWFPYYGNRFADAVAARERRGLPRPDLEGQLEGAADARPPSADALILDSALLLGFTPEREALPTDDDTGELDDAWRAYTDDGLDAVRLRLGAALPAAPRGAAVPGAQDRRQPAGHRTVPHRRRLLPRRPGDPRPGARHRRRRRPQRGSRARPGRPAHPQPRHRGRLRPVRHPARRGGRAAVHHGRLPARPAGGPAFPAAGAGPGRASVPARRSAGRRCPG